MTLANTTVFRQLLDLLPRHEFDAEARQHQEGQRLRVMSRWAQFVALGLGQLGGLQSLRDIVGNLRAQPHKLYHLGVRAFVSRSSLARVNAQLELLQYTLDYEALFATPAESTLPKSRRAYPAAFRQQMVELVRSGSTPGELATRVRDVGRGHTKLVSAQA